MKEYGAQIFSWKIIPQLTQKDYDKYVNYAIIEEIYNRGCGYYLSYEIRKIEDEWYLIHEIDQFEESCYYICDQFDGVIQFFDDFIEK